MTEELRETTLTLYKSNNIENICLADAMLKEQEFSKVDIDIFFHLFYYDSFSDYPLYPNVSILSRMTNKILNLKLNSMESIEDKGFTLS